MLVAVVLLRARLMIGRARERRLVERCRPVLARCLEGLPVEPPALSGNEREPFLRLWNHYHESLRGPAGDRLNQLAARLGFDAAAREMLRAGSLRKRLLAVITLGNLGDAASREPLRALVDSPSVPLSLSAAHALLRIDPEDSLRWLLPVAAGRHDWPLARLAVILAEAGADAVSLPLAAAIRQCAGADDAAARVPRLLRLARFAHTERLAIAVRETLESATNDEVIAACVGALANPRDVDAVRRHARHPAWFVRVAVARALGRLAAPQDRALLLELLGDQSWWVRYRAAQALAALPFINIAELREGLDDRDAVRMLDHVVAERA